MAYQLSFTAGREGDAKPSIYQVRRKGDSEEWAAKPELKFGPEASTASQKKNPAEAGFFPIQDD